jgi:hypothetical protein
MTMHHTNLCLFVKLTEINFRLIYNSTKVSYPVAKIYIKIDLLFTKFTELSK